MTRNKAIEMYFKISAHGNMVINILQKWDSKKTIRKNADAIGVTPDHAEYYRKKFNLGYVKTYRERYPK